MDLILLWQGVESVKKSLEKDKYRSKLSAG